MKKYLLLLAGYGAVTLYLYQNWGSMYYEGGLSHQDYHDQCGVECVDRQLDDKESPEFLIHTPTCVIPNIPVDHPSIAKYKRKTPLKIVCGTKAPLTEEDGLKVKLYPDRSWQYGVLSGDNLNCSYQGIVRINQNPDNYNSNCDKGRKLKNRVPITKEITPIDEYDAILVTCYQTNSTQKPVYRNVHYFVQPERYEEKKTRYQRQLNGRAPMTVPRLNVLIIGTDAVSRGNLIRHMPKTYEYLTKDLGGNDLRGFNKVGENTFPNLVAITAGLSHEEILNHTCYPNKKHKLDDCPFIWKSYAKKGYVTFYLEDAPWMGTFRYTRAGFVEQPTDIYNSPAAFISDGTIGHNAGQKGQNGRICQGGKLTTQVLYDTTLKIAKTLKDVPYWGMTWIAALTHDSLGLASVADDPTLDLLKKMKEGGDLENTVLFFISDHGIRYGSIRSTYAGMLEERLPYVIIVLPQWFKDKYPQAAEHLRINSRRLTSNFDIHATLQDILSFAYNDPDQRSYVDPKHGQSLFKKVPLNRTCEDLGIAPHFCTCQNTTEIDANDPHLWAAANHSIASINKGLSKFKQCVQLTLNKVLSGRVSVPSDSTQPKQDNSVFKKYLVIFSAKPSGAHLESSIQYNNGTYKLVSEVSRINAYGNQSHCVQDFVYRKYCYCKDFLTAKQNKSRSPVLYQP